MSCILIYELTTASLIIITYCISFRCHAFSESAYVISECTWGTPTTPPALPLYCPFMCPHEVPSLDHTWDDRSYYNCMFPPMTFNSLRSTPGHWVPCVHPYVVKELLKLIKWQRYTPCLDEFQLKHIFKSCSVESYLLKDELVSTQVLLFISKCCLLKEPSRLCPLSLSTHSPAPRKLWLRVFVE